VQVGAAQPAGDNLEDRIGCGRWGRDAAAELAKQNRTEQHPVSEQAKAEPQHFEWKHMTADDEVEQNHAIGGLVCSDHWPTFPASLAAIRKYPFRKIVTGGADPALTTLTEGCSHARCSRRYVRQRVFLSPRRWIALYACCSTQAAPQAPHR
jgi:hypothetical protein